LPESVGNIPEKALAVAREFAAGDPFYQGPRLDVVARGGDRVFTFGGKEYVVPAGKDHTGALARYFGDFVGREWLTERLRTKRGRTHPLCQIAFNAQEFAKRTVPRVRAAGRTHYVHCGAEREIMTLAEDMVRLEAANSLPADTLGRLRKRDGYQGARYELAVAAAFVRLGFTIRWIPTSQPGPEFVATHPITGDAIAVEAKSRHRGSEVQFVARADARAIASIKADVGELYGLACKKPTFGLPYAVFIDANIPYRWRSEDLLLDLQELAGCLVGRPQPTATAPAPEFLLCFTSCGWYYALSAPHAPVQYLSTFPHWTTRTPRNFNTFVAIIQAINGMYSLPGSDDIKVDMNAEIAKKLGFADA